MRNGLLFFHHLNQLTRLGIELEAVHAGMAPHPQGTLVSELDAEHERSDQSIPLRII